MTDGPGTNERESLGPQRRGTDPAGLPFEDTSTTANFSLPDDVRGIQTGGENTGPGKSSKYRGSRTQAGIWEPIDQTLECEQKERSK